MQAAFLVLVLAACTKLSAAKERCCPQIGCFDVKYPFDHLPLPSCPEDIQPKLGMYTRHNKADPEFLSTKYVPSALKTDRRTIFVVHGYMTDFNTGWLHEVKDALLDREDANVVIVGWGGGAKNVWYPSSAANTRTVGAQVALVIDSIKQQVGVPPASLWCVGFSLGAHICGHLGMRTHIGRITALDPAGPYFTDYDLKAGVNPAAAPLVDVVHTDGASLIMNYGMLHPRGHMDFYPNEGKYQPGCWTYSYDPVNHQRIKRDNWQNMIEDPELQWSASCSHSRATDLFLWSVRYEDCFASRHICDDHKKLPNSCTSCPSGVCGSMGYDADKYAMTGKFYLETSGKQPFCQY